MGEPGTLPDESDTREVSAMPASSRSNGSGGGRGSRSGNGRSSVGRALLLDVLRGKVSRAEAARQAGVPETAIDAARDALLAAKLPPDTLTLRGIVQRP